MRLWIHAIYIYTYLIFYQKIHVFWTLNIEKHHSYNVISACCKQGEPEVDPQQDRGDKKQTDLNNLILITNWEWTIWMHSF